MREKPTKKKKKKWGLVGFAKRCVFVEVLLLSGVGIFVTRNWKKEHYYTS